MTLMVLVAQHGFAQVPSDGELMIEYFHYICNMKRTIISFVFLLGVSCNSFSQAITVDSLLSFYKNINIDCYKEKIDVGMERLNKWLKDSLPTKTKWFLEPYTPSPIKLQEHDVIPFIALRYYNMGSFDEEESIYDHIIVDSTLSVIFVVLDEHQKAIGITDVAGEPYTYIDFTNKKDANSYLHWDRKVKKFLKVIRKQSVDALVYIEHIWGWLGYIKNGRIYLLLQYKRGKPVELQEYIEERMKRARDMVNKYDWIIWPESEIEYWNSPDSSFRMRLTGNTPQEKIRICN